MLILLSPAKTLDFTTPAIHKKHTQPTLLNDSELLVEQLRQLSPSDLSSLMHISDKLGVLNFTRYSDWNRPFTRNNAKAAVLAFKGDVYSGLNADSFTETELAFAQQHLRILSGLYGVLRPLDLIQPYRLEMGTRLENQRGADLYQFWGDKITKRLNQDLKKINSRQLVNLASNEYFKSVRPEQLNAEIITPVFKDYKNGKYKIISFYAKKARGMMTAFIVQNNMTDIDQIKDFKQDGYRFYKAESDEQNWVFQRKQE